MHDARPDPGSGVRCPLDLAKNEYIETGSIVPRLYLASRLMMELGDEYA